MAGDRNRGSRKVRLLLIWHTGKLIWIVMGSIGGISVMASQKISQISATFYNGKFYFILFKHIFYYKTGRVEYKKKNGKKMVEISMKPGLPPLSYPSGKKIFLKFSVF